MSYSDRFQVGTREAELRRPWPSEAIEHALWLHSEHGAQLDLLSALRQIDTSDPERAEAEASDLTLRLAKASEGAMGWAIGTLVIDPAPPPAASTPARWGRSVVAALVADGWARAEVEALYHLCVDAIGRARATPAPSAVAVNRLTAHWRTPRGAADHVCARIGQDLLGDPIAALDTREDSAWRELGQERIDTAAALLVKPDIGK